MARELHGEMADTTAAGVDQYTRARTGLGQCDHAPGGHRRDRNRGGLLMAEGGRLSRNAHARHRDKLGVAAGRARHAGHAVHRVAGLQSECFERGADHNAAEVEAEHGRKTGEGRGGSAAGSRFRVDRVEAGGHNPHHQLIADRDRSRHLRQMQLVGRSGAVDHESTHGLWQVVRIFHVHHSPAWLGCRESTPVVKRTQRWGLH